MHFVSDTAYGTDRKLTFWIYRHFILDFEFVQPNTYVFTVNSVVFFLLRYIVYATKRDTTVHRRNFLSSCRNRRQFPPRMWPRERDLRSSQLRGVGDGLVNPDRIRSVANL